MQAEFYNIFWQWLVPPLALILAALAGWLLTRVIRAVLRAGARRTRGDWDDAVVDRLLDPLTVALTVAAALLLLPFVDLDAGPLANVRRVARVILLVDFFWATWRIVDVSRHVALNSPWAVRVPASRALVPLGARAAKVLLLAIAIVASLSVFGYPVASLVAGLGIGGLALALAAQKTVENLFGAFSIGVDQPFREGDFVKIEDFVGTVEAIGLRSTRFRTLDRTIITIPNGRLADMKLESFSERDRLRLAAVLGLVYETSAASCAPFSMVSRRCCALTPRSGRMQWWYASASSRRRRSISRSWRGFKQRTGANFRRYVRKFCSSSCRSSNKPAAPLRSRPGPCTSRRRPH
ncbi:MAG TPA: mechanosensitive ion channel family protein [Gemmatimonadaceae bacterium]|nr:mechanosensitive ion channel family protein [Gemmatimonadaceae bacterium]